jgi:hypothetical protein
MQKKFGIALVTALLAASLAAQAQGIPAGWKVAPSADRSAELWAVELAA